MLAHLGFLLYYKASLHLSFGSFPFNFKASLAFNHFFVKYVTGLEYYFLEYLGNNFWWISSFEKLAYDLFSQRNIEPRRCFFFLPSNRKKNHTAPPQPLRREGRNFCPTKLLISLLLLAWGPKVECLGLLFAKGWIPRSFQIFFSLFSYKASGEIWDPADLKPLWVSWPHN